MTDFTRAQATNMAFQSGKTAGRKELATELIKEVEAHVVDICEHIEKKDCEHSDACFEGICGKDCMWWQEFKKRASQ